MGGVTSPAIRYKGHQPAHIAKVRFEAKRGGVHTGRLPGKAEPAGSPLGHEKRSA